MRLLSWITRAPWRWVITILGYRKIAAGYVATRRRSQATQTSVIERKCHLLMGASHDCREGRQQKTATGSVVWSSFRQDDLPNSSAPPDSSIPTGVVYIELRRPGNVIREEQAYMRLLFSSRNAKLETMNRILTDAARERAERVKELERQVAQLEQELEPARKAIERAKELEVVAAERAHLLNEKDKQLADVRETATKQSFRIQELERTLAEIRQK